MRRGMWEGLEHQPRYWSGELLKFLEKREELGTNYSSGEPAKWHQQARRPARQEGLNLGSDFENEDEGRGSRDTDE